MLRFVKRFNVTVNRFGFNFIVIETFCLAIQYGYLHPSARINPSWRLSSFPTALKGQGIAQNRAFVMQQFIARPTKKT
jgi:hypothetical protein